MACGNYVESWVCSFYFLWIFFSWQVYKWNVFKILNNINDICEKGKEIGGGAGKNASRWTYGADLLLLCSRTGSHCSKAGLELVLCLPLPCECRDDRHTAPRPSGRMLWSLPNNLHAGRSRNLCGICPHVGNCFIALGFNNWRCCYLALPCSSSKLPSFSPTLIPCHPCSPRENNTHHWP